MYNPAFFISNKRILDTEKHIDSTLIDYFVEFEGGYVSLFEDL